MANDTPLDPEQWLAAHLTSDPTDACVEWPYSRFVQGYGRLTIDGVTHRVTHLVLDRTGRPRPDPPDHLALHSCDNPPCVNRDHLRWGSQLDNMADAVERDRKAVGEDQGSSVLTEQAVRSIRARYAAGVATLRALADEFGVHHRTISFIIDRETWRHVD